MNLNFQLAVLGKSEEVSHLSSNFQMSTPAYFLHNSSYSSDFHTYTKHQLRLPLAGTNKYQSRSEGVEHTT